MKISSNLEKIGFKNKYLQNYNKNISDAMQIVRVVSVHRDLFTVTDGIKEFGVNIRGKLRIEQESLYPVVGDWCLVQDSCIHDVLPRLNLLSRSVLGEKGESVHKSTQSQSIAANLDWLFVVSGLDNDFNLHRIERYVTLAYNCSINPVIILTKADLVDDVFGYIEQVESVAYGVPIHAVSKHDDDYDQLSKYLAKGETVALMGSSGVGKSTLINSLIGQVVNLTGCVREYDDRGRHTTTSRDMFMITDAAMIIDNPGIREVSIAGCGDGIESSFSDIFELSKKCKFNDCTHTNEPSCNVLNALNNGTLSKERLAHYHKMKKEVRYIAMRSEKSADRVEKERWKDVSMKIKDIYKSRG